LPASSLFSSSIIYNLKKIIIFLRFKDNSKLRYHDFAICPLPGAGPRAPGGYLETPNALDRLTLSSMDLSIVENEDGLLFMVGVPPGVVTPPLGPSQGREKVHNALGEKFGLPLLGTRGRGYLRPPFGAGGIPAGPPHPTLGLQKKLVRVPEGPPQAGAARALAGFLSYSFESGTPSPPPK